MRRFQWILIALCFSVTGAAWADPPDPCCVADVNGDGVVDGADGEYCLPFVGIDNPECDFDGNGIVGPSDFTILATCDGTICSAGVPSLTPTGAGLAAGIIVAAGAWVYRRRRNNG